MYSYLMVTDIIKHCLMSKHVHVVPSDQTVSNMYDHSPNEKNFLQCLFNCYFQMLTSMIKQGNQTMFDRVLSTNISRLDRRA